MNTLNMKPNPYIERLPMENAPSAGAGWGIAGFVGTAVSGTDAEAVYVQSFTEFSRIFGKSGSPYMVNSHLAYAVYDFFKCGGSACYIARVVATDAKVATVTVEGLTATARDKGTWANGVTVKVTANEDNEALFDIAISNSEGSLSNYTALSNTEGDSYWADVIATDEYITLTGDALEVSELVLAGGTDGTVKDENYISTLNLLENCDVTWVAVPGETGATVVKAIQTFVDQTRAGKTFAVLDTPLNAAVPALKAFAQSVPTDMGACFAPWGYVIDAQTGAKRAVPPCGAVLGNFSASVTGRGIAKTPAGIMNTCDGWIGVTKVFSDKDCGILNSANVNCIIPQVGYGICIWGSRVLQENKKQNRKFISQSHLDIYMDKALKELTMFTIFETINDDLMEKTIAEVRALMTELFNAGCFVGATPDEAFSVICDWSNNTPDGETFNVQIGYAKSKPNEFTLITIKQHRATA